MLLRYLPRKCLAPFPLNLASVFKRIFQKLFPSFKFVLIVFRTKNSHHVKSKARCCLLMKFTTSTDWHRMKNTVRSDDRGGHSRVQHFYTSRRHKTNECSGKKPTHYYLQFGRLARHFQESQLEGNCARDKKSLSGDLPLCCNPSHWC